MLLSSRVAEKGRKGKDGRGEEERGNLAWTSISHSRELSFTTVPNLKERKTFHLKLSTSRHSHLPNFNDFPTPKNSPSPSLQDLRKSSPNFFAFQPATTISLSRESSLSPPPSSPSSHLVPHPPLQDDNPKQKFFNDPLPASPSSSKEEVESIKKNEGRGRRGSLHT